MSRWQEIWASVLLIVVTCGGTLLWSLGPGKSLPWTLTSCLVVPVLFAIWIGICFGISHLGQVISDRRRAAKEKSSPSMGKFGKPQRPERPPQITAKPEDLSLRLGVVRCHRCGLPAIREDLLGRVYRCPLCGWEARACPRCGAEMVYVGDDYDVLPPPVGTKWLPLPRTFGVYRCERCGYKERERTSHL